MAIRDLLWACPLCGTVGGIVRAGKGEACRACGASFRRADRSRIEVRLADGRSEIRTATEWSALLPAEPPAPSPAEGGARGGGVAGDGEGAPVEGQGSAPWRRDRVAARFAIGDVAIRHGGRFIGTMERFGPERPGTLTLSAHRVELRLDDGDEHSWALDEVAALQASSRTVQLRPRGGAIVSFAFPDSSARLWEESIAAALRRRWRELGRGEIVEFQPRIVARSGRSAPLTPPPHPVQGRWPAPPSSPGGRA